jgi:hypothetical protein
MVHAGVGIATALGLMLSWYLLALIYAFPVRFISFYADRDVKIGGVIKMNVAAMIPAAIFLSVALLLYSVMELSLPGLLLVWALHFLIQLFYAFCVPFALPKVPSAPVLNPFKDEDEPEEKGRKRRRNNPFKVATD